MSNVFHALTCFKLILISNQNQNLQTPTGRKKTKMKEMGTEIKNEVNKKMERKAENKIKSKERRKYLYLLPAGDVRFGTRLN